MNIVVEHSKEADADCRFEDDLKSIKAQLETLQAQAGNSDLEFLGYLIDMAIHEATDKSGPRPKM